MRSTFGSFNIATSGLFASQRSLNVTSHNIANANTDGYSRQVVQQRADTPMWSNSGVIGTGVETYNIMRLRSEYLDHKYWGQNKAFNEWTIKADSLEELEGVFNEPSDTGIRKVMDEFFSSLEELSKKPGDNTTRINVIEKAIIFAASINRNGIEIVNSIRETNFAIKNKVDEVNSIASQIANLNRQIFNMELGGNKANDLRDQRNVLIDKLSGIVNINVNEWKDANGNSYLNLKIAGVSLVEHTTFSKLTTQDSSTSLASQMGAGDISEVVWEGVTNQPVKILSGELKGLLDIRDGDGVGHNYRGLQFYLRKLNEFAQGFAEKFNDIHKSGVDADGNAGIAFFEEADPTAPPPGNVINCLNFNVAKSVRDNPVLIAAGSASNGESNNGNVKSMIDFRAKNDIFISSVDGSSIKGTPDDFIKSLLSALSVDANQAKRMAENHEVIVEQTKIRRMSESGVDINEEMANMVKFQQAYSASARMITSLDKILDTTINRLGLVGR